jgi:TPR repeat protein
MRHRTSWVHLEESRNYSNRNIALINNNYIVKSFCREGTFDYLCIEEPNKKNLMIYKKSILLLLSIYAFPAILFAQTQNIADLIQRANSGNADAQYQVGKCYISGSEVAQDYTKAFKYSQMSANQNYYAGENLLGLCYEFGKGVAENDSAALECYSKAADQGFADAQYNLARCYDYGKGTAQSYSEAAKWYKKSAAQGFAYAQYSLGTYYVKGYGVKRNNAKAVELFQSAAYKGITEAQSILGVCYEKGYGVKQNYADAYYWYLKAAGQGDEASKAKCNDADFLAKARSAKFSIDR